MNSVVTTGSNRRACGSFGSGPSTRVGAAAGGGSQAEEAASREAETAEVEVVSVSSGEPSDVAEVTKPSRTEGPVALVRVGRDPYQWGSPRLTWSDRNQPGTPPVFVLDDAEEQGYWDRLQSRCEGFNKTLSLALSILHEDIRLAGQRTRKDEEAQRVKAEHVELLRVSAQHVSELGLIRREREQALGERDEARQECIIARQVRDIVKDQLKNATREVSQLAEENHTLTTEVQSLRAVLSHGREREAAKAKEIEGLKGKLAKVGTKLSLAQEALETEQREHSDLCSAVGLVRDAVGMVQVPVPADRSGGAERGLRRRPEEELDAIDVKVVELAKTLAAKFEDEVVPPSLEM
ncbi:unnamed protein product [Miscanthus lutarioriparius]|uniref:Uncharacterized protein n=1 Tax=Miscanthus lutarioriparius TaxID=422564 RepID=A0A811R7D0_9POAL|nr:unnamed protein product [Miscanthus lutarioriparius]